MPGPERLEQGLAELAGGGPLVDRADGAEDLEGDAVLPDRLDALDPGRLEDPALPDGVVRHLLADLSTTSIAWSMSVP